MIKDFNKYSTKFNFGKIILTLILCVALLDCKNSNFNKENSNQKTAVSTEFNFLPTSNTKEIVVHDFYTLSYNEKYEQAEWVAYKLSSDMVSQHHFKRPFFIDDPRVESRSASWKNYKNSGFDKGHLCPAGDMKFSEKAFDDTFFTSNISPQKHDFNDGIWNTLESKVRYWAVKYNEIYVITGGILNNNLQTIGREKVAVPNYFYKVLLTNSGGEYKVIAFLVPAVNNTEPLYKFVVSVDSIEKVTGIDFFPRLNDTLENTLERNSDYKKWSF
ncbi:MAG: DNA/RNA non-specific endonuclease [Flavobacterium sp.]|nr:DNA/RNA non-specific endonuclease [Flavobacterium sp.]